MEDIYSLLDRAHDGDREARDKLVYENTGLVWSVVRRFSYSGAEREELFQIGVIGLLKAIDRFDPSFQVCFSTYAVPAISGELKRFLRDDGPIKISRSIQDHQKKIREFQEEWERKRVREGGAAGGERVDGELSLEELSRGTGLSTEEIVLAQGSMKPVESIYQTVYESSDSSLQLIDQLAETEENFDERAVNRTVLAESLERLSPGERQLIYCRYFKDMTQAATAKELGMTQVQVSRTEKKILEKLRKMFGDETL